jgi:hypothetical protein
MRRSNRTITAILVTALGFVLILSAAPGIAQDQPIEYGQTVTGEITNRDFEIGYVFTGAEGDVVIVRMAGAELEGGAQALSEPQVIMLDADFTVIGSSSYGYPATTFFWRLPTDGDYTILATRTDGRAGDSVGGYKLELINPETLPPGKTMLGTVLPQEPDYYAVIGEPFTVETPAVRRLLSRSFHQRHQQLQQSA